MDFPSDQTLKLALSDHRHPHRCREAALQRAAAPLAGLAVPGRELQRPPGHEEAARPCQGGRRPGGELPLQRHQQQADQQPHIMVMDGS